MVAPVATPMLVQAPFNPKMMAAFSQANAAMAPQAQAYPAAALAAGITGLTAVQPQPQASNEDGQPAFYPGVMPAPTNQQQQQHGQMTSEQADYSAYGAPPPKKRKKNGNKKKKTGAQGGNGPHGGHGGHGSSRSPQIRVQKKPRLSSGNPAFYDFNSPTDLESSGTLHKWKYPWLYANRPNDDDEEEEGETEVNIRFFNNFSRMGPFGNIGRVGGTATLFVSLAFLIISNISLAFTVVAHGVSAFLRNSSAQPNQQGNYPDRNRKREHTLSPQQSRVERPKRRFFRSRATPIITALETTTSTTTTTPSPPITTTTTSTTPTPSTTFQEPTQANATLTTTSTSPRPITTTIPTTHNSNLTLDQRIKLFGEQWMDE